MNAASAGRALSRKLRRLAARATPRTLRSRLILGLAAILTILCAGLVFATATVVSHYLVDGLDQRLAETGGRYAASLEHPASATAAGTAEADAPAISGDTRAQAPGTLGIRLLNGSVTNAAVVDGDADDASGSVDDKVTLSAPDQTALAALPRDGSARSVELSGIGAYRVRAQAGRDGDILITGLPLEHVEQTVHQLAGAEMAMFAAALVLGAAAAAGWVRLALRPLDRVARTAERVSSLPLAAGEVALPMRVPHDDPASEVGRVGASLNRMLGHVEDALAKRHAVEGRLREFAADASHELRTPVAAIRGHAELAQRHPGDIPEPVRRSLGRIEAESRRMGTLVDDLLLLARLDAGRPLAREQVDLTRLALDAVDDARAAAPAHRWRLELPAEPTIVAGDRHRLHQAVANLLANARTHTPDGTEVTLRLDGAARPNSPNGAVRPDDVVCISITDTGPGLDTELAARAFDRFTRGDRTRSRASGSTGLGLAITRAIAEAHGGRVELESRPGHTVFTIVLPAAHERDETVGTAP